MGYAMGTMVRFSIDFLLIFSFSIGFSLVFHWFSTKIREIVGPRAEPGGVRQPVTGAGEEEERRIVKQNKTPSSSYKFIHFNFNQVKHNH